MTQVKYRDYDVGAFLWFFLRFFLNIGKIMCFRVFVASIVRNTNHQMSLYDVFFRGFSYIFFKLKIDIIALKHV
jgi:hypothetical protein